MLPPYPQFPNTTTKYAMCLAFALNDIEFNERARVMPGARGLSG